MSDVKKFILIQSVLFGLQLAVFNGGWSLAILALSAAITIGFLCKGRR